MDFKSEHFSFHCHLSKLGPTTAKRGDVEMSRPYSAYLAGVQG